jgi:hypothetical protein
VEFLAISARSDASHALSHACNRGKLQTKTERAVRRKKNESGTSTCLVTPKALPDYAWAAHGHEFLLLTFITAGGADLMRRLRVAQ